MANLIQSAKAQVSQLTAQAYEAAVAAEALPAGVELKGSVEIPKDPQNGDYASSVAMAGAKAMKMAPRAIAQALVDHMDLAGTIFSSVEIAGPGFLNFTLGSKWYGGVLAAAVVAFPLMYRTARGAFESFDDTLAYSAQTLGLSNTYIFWHIRMPYCRQGILAGTVLAFARALGEYGATSMLIGYTPGRTATISTTVYQLWRTNDEAGAFFWVMVNLGISAVVLLIVNMLERRTKGGRA